MTASAQCGNAVWLVSSGLQRAPRDGEKVRYRRTSAVRTTTCSARIGRFHAGMGIAGPRSRAGPRQSASPARSCARHALDQHDVIRIKLKVLNVGLVRSGARSMRLFTEAPRTRSVPASLAAMGRLVSPYGLVSKLTPLPIREGEPF